MIALLLQAVVYWTAVVAVAIVIVLVATAIAFAVLDKWSEPRVESGNTDRPEREQAWH